MAAGEAVGIIGPNGAGKSTLLKVLAGIVRPTAGTAEVRGSARSLIELSAGFHPDLTGRENVVGAGVLAGLSRAEAERVVPEIAAFADLEAMIDEPVKHYSTGMRARLAFAAVTQERPDVLAVDEALAVGDRDFQVRCLERIGAMVAEGTALLFVSHEMPMVAQVCDRVVRMEHGRVVDDATPPEVIERYLGGRRPASVLNGVGPIAIEGCTVPPRLALGDAFRFELVLRVDRPVRRPAIELELTFQFLNPDAVLTSSYVELDDIDVPGRYHVTGTAQMVPAYLRNMRFTIRAHADGRPSDEREAVIEHVGGSPISDIGPNGYRLALPVATSHRLLDDVARPVALPTVTAEDPADAVLVVRSVSKRFEAVAPWRQVAPMGRRPSGTGVLALDGVGFAVRRGESVGVVGPNGAGKSTLLRTIAGVTRPDHGSVELRGRLAPVLTIDGLIHRDLSGRDQIALFAGLLGIGGADLRSVSDHIVEVSGLADALDVPVSQYSSGMRARLGLAIALHAPGDVLLVDELLSVGDEAFRRQTIEMLAARRSEGTALLVVSHELALIEALCDRCLCLVDGRLVDDGPTGEVLGRYAERSSVGGFGGSSETVRLRSLRLERAEIPYRGHVRGTAVVHVDVPMERAALVLSLRAVPEDRAPALPPEVLAAMTCFEVDVAKPGGLLIERGSHQVDFDLDMDWMIGNMDLVLSCIDREDGRLLAEIWEQIAVGSPGPGTHPASVLEATWSVREERS